MERLYFAHLVLAVLRVRRSDFLNYGSKSVMSVRFTGLKSTEDRSRNRKTIPTYFDVYNRFRAKIQGQLVG